MSKLYAITASREQFIEYLKLNIPYVQYRNKQVPFDILVAGIETSSKIIVNDSLEQAKASAAWGVHLGQSDLDSYSIEQLLDRDLKLGISTHSQSEIARALEYKPDYIAFGPIFQTSTKEVGFAPQGLERLREVVCSVPVPVVAIGGITPQNFKSVAATGVEAIASISALDAFGVASFPLD